MSKLPPKVISVLCAGTKSAYHNYPGVIVFDKTRDAKTFKGNTPVLGHPPCRAWSAFCKHQAKPEPGEKELGIWVCAQVKRYGGIIEQPAYSGLFEAAGLPKPDEIATESSFSICLLQSWWGYPCLKKTWLYFSKISRSEINLPFQFDVSGSRKKEAHMSKRQRSETVPEFAKWLVALTRKAGNAR